MKNIFLLSFLFLAFLSCTKEIGVTGPAGPQGPSGSIGNSPSDTGSILGRLDLFDEFSYKKNDASGTIITLTSGSLIRTDTTGPTGQYRFSGLRTGTYDLSYQKTGYGTMKLFGLSHFGGGPQPTSIYDIDVLQIPQKTAVDNLAIFSNDGLNTVFSILLDTSSLQYVQYYQNFQLFISKDKNVSPFHFAHMIGFLFTPDGNGKYSAVMGKTDVTNPLPFKTGDTLYAVTYTYNRYVHPTVATDNFIDPGGQAYYIDPQTGLIIYPNMSRPSNILQFVY
jgi:hypothetical protein